jgi:hypothetical protein
MDRMVVAMMMVVMRMRVARPIGHGGGGDGQHQGGDEGAEDNPRLLHDGLRCGAEEDWARIMPNRPSR